MSKTFIGQFLWMKIHKRQTIICSYFQYEMLDWPADSTAVELPGCDKLTSKDLSSRVSLVSLTRLIAKSDFYCNSNVLTRNVSLNIVVIIRRGFSWTQHNSFTMCIRGLPAPHPLVSLSQNRSTPWCIRREVSNCGPARIGQDEWIGSQKSKCEITAEDVHLTGWRVPLGKLPNCEIYMGALYLHRSFITVL